MGTLFNLELEFGNVGFWGEGKTGVLGEKPHGAEKRTNNKLNPHMTPGLGIKPGTQCWEASALTTATSLLPHACLHVCPHVCLLLISINPIVFLSTARFTNKSPQQSLVYGMSGILNCSAEGNPPPRFTWTRRDGKALDKRRLKQQPNGNIHVDIVHKDDGGELICTIEQGKGTRRTTRESQTITVSIIGKTSSFPRVILPKNHRTRSGNRSRLS